MKLESIDIRNYRSIEDLTFSFDRLDDKSFTYGLIGVNEAGKSSILKALALKDGFKNEKGEPLPLQRDFKDKNNDIEIEYRYSLADQETQELTDYLKSNVSSFDLGNSDLGQIKLTVSYLYSSPDQPVHLTDISPIQVSEEEKQALKDHLSAWVKERSHKAIFWVAEDRYLISQPINLSEFANSPDSVSIPLKNCFALIGFTGSTAIQEAIASISDSTEREQLQNDLSEKVTQHINGAWPNHRVRISFNISDGLINFHVHDLDATGKAKTADQRSDGFRQFISFLLTISAQNKNQELTNTLLLLDEPETHLHPQAQEDLLRELIKITQNDNNNLCLFATHSNYMIDKDDLSRNYKVVKTIDRKSNKEETSKEPFDKKTSTYASVTYEVFDIPSTDYHNELYAKAHEKYKDADPTDDKREGILNFDTNFLHMDKTLKKDRPWKGAVNQCTLPTYIRNCIHHPDNGNRYTNDELRKSIEVLISYLNP